MKKTISISLFSSLYALSFFFKKEDLGMPDNIKVIIIKEKKVEIYNDITYSVLRNEIKGNETRKDYNALTDLIKIEVRGVFFY
jgi:hypothetical protein